MDIRKLRQFIAVSETGSFGRAAKQTNLTQPSLTRNIKALEHEMAVPLFERGPRGTHLSAAGRKFLPHAQSIVNEFDRAVTELDPSRTKETEQVRLGASPNFMFDAVPVIVADCIARAPDMNITVSSGTFGELVAALRAREVDMLLCLAPDFTGMRGTEMLDLRFESLARETLTPVASVDHPVRDGPCGLVELAECRWALPLQMAVLYRFESAFHRKGLAIPMQCLNTASLAVVRRVARTAGLLAMLPSRLVEEERSLGGLAPLDVPELRFDYVVAMITLQAPLSPATALVADAVALAMRNY